MAFSLFKPKGATEKNFMQYEKDLYIALETLKEVCKHGEKEKDCYLIQSTNKAYRKAFNLSYSLVKFYTKHREESKEYMFKRNFLLTKTRGLFSKQESSKNALSDLYYVKCDLIESLPSNYFKMFHLNKSFGEELPENLEHNESK